MEPLIIHKTNGDLLALQSTVPLCTVTKATQSKALLGDDTVSLSINSTAPLNFGIGDTLTVFGEDYTLNRLPGAKKNGDFLFSYDLTLEGAQYSLIRLLYFNTDVSGFNTGTEFSLTGNLKMFAGVLMNNINRGGAGWSLVPVVDTPVKTLTFSNENCLRALQRICEEFGVEFAIRRTSATTRTLTIAKIGTVQNLAFEYGRAGGLYELSRTSVTDKEFITRLYAYGSTKNIPANYRGFSTRLKLAGTVDYLEKPTAKTAFGLIEGTKEFDDVYPHRTGTVATVGSDLLTFVDATMDFDLKATNGTVNGKPDYKYLLPGQSAKVSFLTGNLAGYELEVSDYNHATKTFKIKAFTDERGLVFPSAGAFSISPGDTYVLINLIMPEVYVTNAEAELLTVAQAYLDQNAAPRVQYALTLDEMFLRSRAVTGAITNFFALGDYVRIKDAHFAIDTTSRVIGFTREILTPYVYTLDIADTYQVQLIERILAAQTETRTILKANDMLDVTKARYNWRNTQELLDLVFDADGNFNGENINPETIETALIAIGAKSGQFALSVVIEPNYNTNPNSIHVEGGLLVHYGIEELVRTWQIEETTVTITDNTARYIYGRCSRTDYADGAIIFSTEQLQATDNATYYFFLIGILHAVDTDRNVRAISLTYGSTTVNGRFIRTGRIQSGDGATYFDLDSGEIGGNIVFLAPDGSKKPIDALTKTMIDGGLITSGTLMLAGVGGSIRAGVTGEGSNEESVRFWAGSAYENRGSAPFRVQQSGEVSLRKRLELMNSANIGQAGIAGANSTADGTTRFWAGTDYENRDHAPFKVDSEGAITATKGKVGGLGIDGTYLTNEGFQNDAAIILRNDPEGSFAGIGSNVLPASSGLRAIGRLENTKVDTFATNYGLILKATGGFRNLALYAGEGISFLGELLTGGQRTYKATLTSNNLQLDPTLFGFISLNCTTSDNILTFVTPYELPLLEGKRIDIINRNNGGTVRLSMVRSSAPFILAGGCGCSIIYTENVWQMLGHWDLDF